MNDMDYYEERVSIVNTCRKMCEMSYFIGTWGNVSVRVGDYILLTPSRVDYDIMKYSDIIVIDMDGNKIQGDKNPTSEKEVHRQIYLKRKDVGAVIHAHTANAMAVSAMDVDQVPCLVEEMSQLLGGGIPVTKTYVAAENHFELGRIAGETIGNKNGVIRRNHGPVACGKNLGEAVLSAKVVEKSCGIYLNCLQSGVGQRVIPEHSVESEHYRYQFTYGKEQT